MAIVWPCPLPVDAYVAAGREVEVPRPDCPLCGEPLMSWSGYWRHVRAEGLAGGRCRKIFVPRVRCAPCRVSHALLPAFVLAWRLDTAETIGAVIAEVAGGACGVRPAAARLGVPYTTARGWVRRFRARAWELGVGFAALAVELGGEAITPAGPGEPVGAGRDRRGVRRGRRAAGMAPAGRVAVRVVGERREADRRQQRLALPDRRQTAFHASYPAMTARQEDEMDKWGQEEIALHRWAVIAEAAGDRLTPRERGALVRRIAARAHTHPDGSARRYSRGTIDRWLRAWRRGGLEALKPSSRADAGAVRAHPELFAEAAALRLELPGRSAAQIASILYHRHGITVSERTVRGQLRRAGLHREALAAEPKAYGRYEAARPNERWITDVLVGPWVPYPKREGSVRARLFLIVDDHSRLLVDGRFFAHENARACQDLLRRAITRRGLPDVFYADNGAPFSNAWLARTCGVLGIRLVHSKPYSPEGRGKQERLNRYIREAFLAEATHHGIESLDALNDLFTAWAGQVANRRVHAETGQTPIGRFEAGGPPRQASPDRLREAFRWSVTRRVTRTATVPLEGNAYAVDPALTGRRVELRYDPEDLTRIEVFLDGKPAGAATPFVTRRHVHRAVPQAARPDPAPTGIDYLGLVAAAHEEAAGTGAKIDFTALGRLTAGEPGQDQEPGQEEQR